MIVRLPGTAKRRDRNRRDSDIADVPPRAASLSIVHVLDTEGYAGRESVVEQLVSGQREAGFDVRVVAVVEEGGGCPPFVDAARDTGIPLHVLRLAPRAYLEERRRLVQLFRRHDLDLMHSHGYRPDVVGGSAASRAGLARVSTVHGFIGGGWRNRCYEWVQRWSLRGFEGVVGVSRTVADDLLDHGVPQSRVHVVRNAWESRNDFLSRWEARDRLGVEEDRFLLGWVGRLNRVKGPDVLLAALHHSSMSDLSVSVIGDGPERQPLAQQAETLPPETRLHWHGHLRDAYRVFPAFDALVLSSRSEGTPMVLLEAMAAGVPVVATEVGGVPEVISEDEAWLVPPENPAALWSAVAQVRENPGEARARAAAAGDLLEAGFGMDRWVSRYAEIYRQSLQLRGEQDD